MRVKIPVTPTAEGDINTFAFIFLAECKASLQEFKELGNFKDSMGKLGAVVLTVGELAYLFISSISEFQAIPVAVASVMPVYTLSILIMSEIDKARDKALDDVLEVINPRVDSMIING